MKQLLLLAAMCIGICAGCNDNDSDISPETDFTSINGNWHIVGTRTIELNNVVGQCGGMTCDSFTDMTLGASGTMTYGALSVAASGRLACTFEITYPDGAIVQIRGEFSDDGNTVSGTWSDNRGVRSALCTGQKQ